MIPSPFDYDSVANVIDWVMTVFLITIGLILTALFLFLFVMFVIWAWGVIA